MRGRHWIVAIMGLAVPLAASSAEPTFKVQEIDASLGVGYAVRVLDMNGDGKRDILVVDQTRLVWFENPSWRSHVFLQGKTKPDNVCVAPSDIDGDGAIDLAIGADWRPFDTQTGGTIQWARKSAASDGWEVFPIAEEPTVHRMQWADLHGDGKPELIVVPLMGRNTTRPHFAEHPVRVLAYSAPTDPARDRWPVEVLNQDIHVCHNFHPTDFDHDGALDVLLASFEGVSLLTRGENNWRRRLLGAGNQATTPNRGASEIKHGRLAAGDYIATIEPWHGFEVVVYTKPAVGETLWRRRVLDNDLLWGHAVWCANLDNDADEELIIGARDDKPGGGRRGVRVYDPRDGGANWNRHILEAGGVAVEDLVADDLNGDGAIDIIAVGRQTHNARIYWNQSRQ